MDSVYTINLGNPVPEALYSIYPTIYFDQTEHNRDFLAILPPYAIYQIQVDVPFGDNAFAIMGVVSKAIKKAGATPEQVKQYMDESMSGDYNHLMAVVTEWVEVL